MIKRLGLSVVLSFIMACSSPMTKTENYLDKTTYTSANEPDNREPATITKKGNDDYEMVTCSLTPNEKFKILKNGKDMNRGGRTDASGCVKTSFRDGAVKAGDNLVIVINEKNQSSETVPATGGGNGSGGNTGSKPPHPTPAPAPQPPPSLPTVDIGKVRSNAENNARCMANAVVEAYGKMERYRYNFQRGLREGLYIYNWTNLGSLRTTADYIKGAQDGEARGSSEGLVRGREAGATEGQSEGGNSAYRNFSAVVDTGSPPNLDNTPPAASYQGAKSPLSAPRSVEERISAANGEVQSWLRSVDFSYDDWRWDPWGDYWSPAKLYSWNNYDFDLIRSWYRDDWAWTLWKQKSFSRCRDQVAYYEKISDSSQTKNSYEAERAFRSTFKEEYDSVIGQKWNNAVRKEEPLAFAFGRNLGFKIGQEYARETGYYNGHSTSYSAASIEGYKETYASGFRNGFDSAKKLYENSAYLTDLSGEVKPGSGNGFGVGTPINVTLKSLKNIGRQPGEPKVSLAGNTQVNSSKTFNIGHSQSLKEPVSFTALSYVGTAGAPNQNSQITLKVDSVQQSFNIHVDWDETVKNLSSSSPEISKSIVDYMKYYLALEWKDVKSGLGGNKYKSPPSDTLLEKLADTYNQGSPELKGKIKSKMNDLKSVLGARPGFLAFDDKAKWDSAGKIYDSMK